MTKNAPAGITALFLFRFSTTANRWWAFKQMRLGPETLKDDPHLQFFKILGTGGGRGFSIWPDWGTYAILVTARNEYALQQFSDKNQLLAQYRSRSSEHLQLTLRAFQSHGSWGGVQPFARHEGIDTRGPIAVITRASIRPSRLGEFWRKVPGVSAKITESEGLLFAKGIGEWPLIEQATFSLWSSAEHMQDFAYQRPRHAEVVKKTRTRNWYSEELFARFEVREIRGNWPGINTSNGRPLINK